MKIEVFPAEYGDCFLVTIKNKHILIDCGFESTYINYLKKRLESISEKGGCIDLLVVTHLHSDHILGINLFLEENGDNKNPNVIKINEVWFNGFKHVHMSKRLNEELEEYTKEILENLKKQGYLVVNEIIQENKTVSETEAISLTELIIQNGINWNTSLSGKAITADHHRIKIDNDIFIVLLSPTTEALTKLDMQWLRYLKRKKSNVKITTDELFDQTFEYILSQEQEALDENYKAITDSKPEFIQYPFEQDKSIVNKSSIAFIIESNNKKALFLGDAHSTDIENALNNLVNDENYDLEFDFTKISHHGSEGNMSPELLKMISCRKYLISTNGKHPRHIHPDSKLIARVLANADYPLKELIFNYNVPMAELTKNLAKQINVFSPDIEKIIEIDL